ncbi:single-stranded DNA-binding protein [Ancylobacter sp.]|uniref:single-stranded DNA-binding protein n=1 Tax=Ancylobacter sp. TaxID=1872567 RepID=UPI003C799F2C
MPNHSSATIIGHLGRNPETRTTQAGKLIFNAALAVNTGYGDNKRTTWRNVTAFGRTAETLEKFNLAKGMPIGFTGEASLRPWTDKDGNERQSLELSVGSFILLGEKSDRDESSRPAPAAKAKQVVADAPFDDEIPF